MESSASLILRRQARLMIPPRILPIPAGELFAILNFGLECVLCFLHVKKYCCYKQTRFLGAVSVCVKFEKWIYVEWGGYCKLQPFLLQFSRDGLTHAIPANSSIIAKDGVIPSCVQIFRSNLEIFFCQLVNIGYPDKDEATGRKSIVFILREKTDYLDNCQ